MSSYHELLVREATTRRHETVMPEVEPGALHEVSFQALTGQRFPAEQPVTATPESRAQRWTRAVVRALDTILRMFTLASR